MREIFKTCSEEIFLNPDLQPNTPLNQAIIQFPEIFL